MNIPLWMLYINADITHRKLCIFFKVSVKEMCGFVFPCIFFILFLLNLNTFKLTCMQDINLYGGLKAHDIHDSSDRDEDVVDDNEYNNYYVVVHMYVYTYVATSCLYICANI